MRITKSHPAEWDVLIVCGGVGGEGTLLANLGFRKVTVSDFSKNALEICKVRDARLQTCILNVEQLDLPDDSFDLVLVQDGLHHLPRPALGLTEMLRVARRAVVVVEPHSGVVAKLLGTVWECKVDKVNHVFRWNQLLLEQVTLSYLLQIPSYIKAIRLWDHNVMMSKLAKLLGSKRVGLFFVKFCYFFLNSLFWWLGNMMIGIVVKHNDKL